MDEEIGSDDDVFQDDGGDGILEDAEVHSCV